MMNTRKSIRYREIGCLMALLMACALPLNAADDAPGDDAVKAYRQYVAAIRAGSASDVLKLVEAVPESSRELVKACVESAVAIEAVKTEAIRQFGPPKPDEDGWDFGQLPDNVLDKLVGEVAKEDTVRLVSKDEQVELPYELLMIRRDGKWLVPASIVIGIETAVPYPEPPQDEREAMLKQAQFTTAGAKVVLEKLKKKEYKTPDDVYEALLKEMLRAGGGLGEKGADQPD